MTQPTLKPRGILAGMALALLWLVPIAAARAGSITADSINSREAARQAAIQQMPRGATVLRSHCQGIQVGAFGPLRYRCTVWFSPASAPAPAPEQIPAAEPPAADSPGAPAAEVTVPGTTSAP